MPHMIKIWNKSVQLSRIFKQYTINSDKNTIYFYLVLIFNFYFFPQIPNSNIDHPLIQFPPAPIISTIFESFTLDLDWRRQGEGN